MRIMETDEARRFMSMYPQLRVSDIPDAGLLTQEGVLIHANNEGEITLLDAMTPEDNS
jgi:hypothetical protein